MKEMEPTNIIGLGFAMGTTVSPNTTTVNKYAISIDIRFMSISM